MPQTASQIVTNACQIAKCPGFTTQGGQFLNSTLQDLCQGYDLEAALGTNTFSFNSAAGQGSGPYTLPVDYLRTRVQDGKDEFFYTINGVPYPLIQCTLTEYDWMVQTAGFQDFPYYYATDLTTSPPTMKVWPPASGSYACIQRYYRLMPDIVTPETSAVVPWFLNTEVLMTSTAGRLMALTGDERYEAYMSEDVERHPTSWKAKLNTYLKNVEDREGAVHTVGRDRRRWGRSFDLLKNTKTIGWMLPFLFLAWAWLAPVPANACTAPCTKAQIATDISANWPDNTVGSITPALLRTTVLELVNSYLDTNGTSAFNCSSHQFLNTIVTLSSYSCAQPGVNDLSGFGTGVATALGTAVNTLGGFPAITSQTTNFFYKSNGLFAATISSVSDNGAFVISSEPIDTTNQPHVQEIANAGSTGTTVNKLAKLTGTPSTAVIATTTDTTGNVVGIVIGGAGTTGSAQIAITGQASCVFDGAITAGHYVQVSTSAGGSCHDGGGTFPTAGQILGIIIAATNASPGTTPQAMTLFPPGILGSTGTSSGTVTMITAGNGINLSSGATCTTTCTISATAVAAPTGRITLLTGTPVLSASQAGATTVYYTPYLPGDNVPLWNGTTWVPTALTEVSQATTDTTKSPAAVAASSCYDLFAWSDSGTFRVTRGPVWTNCTTRSAGSALTSGSIPLNSVSITNGPAASRGTWVGSIASNGSSTIDYIFGAVGTGGTSGAFNLWNAYNRVMVRSFSGANSGWGNITAGWAQPHSGAGVLVAFMLGGTGDGVMGHYLGQQASGTSIGAVGVGLDSTSVPCGSTSFIPASIGAGPMVGRCEANPTLGQHTLYALEYAASASTNTMGGTTGVYGQTGLSVELWQ